MQRSTSAKRLVRLAPSLMALMFAVLAFHVALEPTAFGQSAAVSSSTSTTDAGVDARGAEQRSRIANLIEQLAAPDFSLRESATMELLAIGEPAIRQLSHAPADLPFEARERCGRIEAKISTELFARRSRQFLLDADASKDYGLPGWERFHGIVGVTRTSKLLFLEMLEADRDLVQLIVQADGEAGQGAAKQELVTQVIRTAEELNARLYTHSAPGLGEYVSLLYAAVAMDGPPPIEVNRTLFSACQFSFGGYLNKAGYQDCLKRLLGAWVPRTHDGMASDAIRLAHGLALPVAAPIARTRLSKNFDVVTRSVAFQYIAFYGEASDLPALLEHVDDTTVVEEYSELESDIAVARVAPPGIPFVPPAIEDERKGPMHTVRISDLAALSAMMVLGDEPSRVFPRYSGQIEGKIILHELAVTAEDAPKRAAAIRAWVQAQLGAPPQG